MGESEFLAQAEATLDAIEASLDRLNDLDMVDVDDRAVGALAQQRMCLRCLHANLLLKFAHESCGLSPLKFYGTRALQIG